MLEKQALLVRGWTSSEPPRREISDVESGKLVGVVRRQPVRWPWLAWLLPGMLDVCEAEDEPLLFTLRRQWGLELRWEVCDADGRRVGMIGSEFLLDRFGRCLALVERSPDSARIHFRSVDGVELGSVTPRGSEALLRFALPAEGDPFAKMVLLGTALVH
jgi:hypothetical protein